MTLRSTWGDATGDVCTMSAPTRPQHQFLEMPAAFEQREVGVAVELGFGPPLTRPAPAGPGAFEPEARLVAGVVGPGEVYLAGRDGGGGQVGWSRRRALRCRRGGVGVGGVVWPLVGADAVGVGGAGGQAGVRIGLDVGDERRDLEEVHAVCGAFDPKGR